jgi:hypothetical protein
MRIISSFEGERMIEKPPILMAVLFSTGEDHLGKAEVGGVANKYSSGHLYANG